MLNYNLSNRLIKTANRDLDKVTAKYRHFTFIIKRNTVICHGYNKIFHSHPISKQYEYRYDDIHSELAAILKFPYPVKELKKFYVVNLRVRRDNGQPGFARPCKKCIKMLKSFQINEIYYSNEIGGWSFEQF